MVFWVGNFYIFKKIIVVENGGMVCGYWCFGWMCEW